MRVTIIVLSCLTAFAACDRVKRTAKETINKTGETVGRTTTEFADGVSEGIDKTFQSQLAVSPALQQEGLSAGRFSISSTDTTKNNILTAYLIFDKDFNKDVVIKVMDRQGVEYGRVRQQVAGAKGEAQYFDFVFHKRTQIESKSRLVIE